MIEVINNPSDKLDTKSSTDTGISKEDEERYQKLLNENEELQRLISQVNRAYFNLGALGLQFFIKIFLQKEDKIRILRQRLSDMDASTRKN